MMVMVVNGMIACWALFVGFGCFLSTIFWGSRHCSNVGLASRASPQAF